MTQAKPQFLGVLAGVFLAAGLVLSAMLVTKAWLKIAETQTITVTGSARKNVRADLVLWRGFFSAEATTLAEAQKKLTADRAKVEGFLHENGIKEFEFTTVSIEELREAVRGMENGTPKRTGYKLSQSVQLQSGEVDRITQLDRDTGALVEQGVLFTTTPPQYIYTKAAEAKVVMLAEAAQDARVRADQIAAPGGRKIAQMRAAKMGVFQITPLYSGDTSWEGVNDTSAVDKTMTAVVSATFSMQ